MKEDRLIPREVLFGNPDKIAVRMSEDGKYISYLAPLEGVLNVFVAPANNPLTGKAITVDKERGIRSYEGGGGMKREELVFQLMTAAIPKILLKVL